MSHLKNEVKEKGYYAGSRPEMLAFVPEDCKNILEVGCGKGNFSQEIKRRNSAHVTGIEIIPDAAREAESKLDKVMVGDFLDLAEGLKAAQFDCIIMNDVLEHMIDTDSVMKMIKRLLKKDGYFVASIPNFREFQNIRKIIFNKDFEYTNSGILDNTHFRFFTEKSIKRLMMKHKFDIVEMKGINRQKSWKIDFLNILSFGFIKDMRYLQYAIVAKV